MAKLSFKAGAYELVQDITGENLLQVIANILPKDKLPDGFSYDSLVVAIGGEKVDLKTFDISKQFDCDVEITMPPQGIDPISLLYIAAALVLSVSASLLLAPDAPTSRGAKDSPNNSFFGQTNQIRLDEQDPNLYGENVSYPDSIVRDGGVWEYVDNIKKVWQLFEIGSGAYDKEAPKYELTPLSDITGSTHVFYEPFDIVPVVKGQFNSELIDGQMLLGPNNDETSGVIPADSLTATIFIDPVSDYMNVIVPITPEWTNVLNGLIGGFGARNPVRFSYLGLLALTYLAHLKRFLLTVTFTTWL